MGATITLAGENLIAQKLGAQQMLTAARFILANVPGLDPEKPVDRAAGKPPVAQIVGTFNVTQAGYVNTNQVVYSMMLGSDIGDFDWNWIGLETADGVLLMVAYVPLQQKRRNQLPQQVGNNVTRNFLLVFDGAKALTGVTVDASTWQHDFTVRLAGIDERKRLANRDIFGRACFFGSSLQVEKVGDAYQVKAGMAYVEGIRLERTAVLPIVPPALPTTAWVDVALQRELSDVVASWQVVFSADRPDYTDSAGVRHYCVALADLVNANTLTDRRPVEEIGGPLVSHFAARVGDYEHLRARATTKSDVQLDQIPNAISDEQDSNSSAILATTKAVKAATSFIWNAIANIVSGATVVGKSARWSVARRISMNGAMSGSVDIDGSSDVTLIVAATQATENTTGGARVATQPQTDIGIDDTTYVTPKKLRWGFAFSLGSNGFIAYPSWMGGMVRQWGQTTAANVTFPLRFPNSLQDVTLAVNNHNSSNAINGYHLTTTATSTTGFTVAVPVSSLATAAVLKWVAIGN